MKQCRLLMVSVDGFEKDEREREWCILKERNSVL